MQRYLKYTLLNHVIFWVACFFILYRLFTQDYQHGWIDWIHTILFIGPMMCIVYINRSLLDYAIHEKKMILYPIGLIAIVAVGAALHYLFFDVISDILFSEYFIVSYYTVWEVVQYSLIFIAITTLIKLTKDWFWVKDREMKLARENHQVQLSALQSQVNPHFLFNSLNNIYALSSSDMEATRKYILRLSDALRYMIYETREEKVLLQDELDYLADYISLEKLRMSQPVQVTFSYPEDTSELIAPLMLLPLVENCFKHVDKQHPMIHISVKLEDTQLTMTTSNSYRKGSAEVPGGLGMDNLRKRLDLIYPGLYSYDVHEEDDQYTALLTIDLRP